ncbi:MAG: hypothetical protein AB1631_07900 [Acidobacteriota bacterium]
MVIEALIAASILSILKTLVNVAMARWLARKETGFASAQEPPFVKLL